MTEKLDKMHKDEREELSEILADILETIKQQAGMAMDIARDIGDGARAKAYWFAQISMALDGDHDYLGSGTHTMQDTLNLINEFNEGA